MPSGYCNRYEPQPQNLRAPGFKQKPLCHLLFEASMSTEQLCYNRAAGLEGGLAWGAQGCDPFPQPGCAGPPELLWCFCAPQPTESWWPAANLPHTAAAPLQFGITSRCALQLASRLLTQALNARGLCLLLRESTNSDQPLHLCHGLAERGVLMRFPPTF